MRIFSKHTPEQIVVKRVCVPVESQVPVMGTRRRFAPEYRRDFASLVLDTGSSIAAVARDLGLGKSVVRRRVPELEKENEFLGKACAFFASGHQNTSGLNRWTCPRLPTQSP